jgi:hypothetical protein
LLAVKTASAAGSVPELAAAICAATCVAALLDDGPAGRGRHDVAVQRDREADGLALGERLGRLGAAEAQGRQDQLVLPPVVFVDVLFLVVGFDGFGLSIVFAGVCSGAPAEAHAAAGRDRRGQ